MDIVVLHDSDQLDGSVIAEKDWSPLLDSPVLPLMRTLKSQLLVPLCQQWFLNCNASREFSSLEMTLDSWCGYLDTILSMPPLA